MRTERQIEASRANGARSRGPVTPEGKYNSSRNAFKHGLLADTIVLKSELEHRFLELLDDLMEELQPETSIEYSLVETLAAARWRQLRIWGMETAGMNYQIRNQADSFGRGEDKATCASRAFRTLSDDSRSLDLINRYDSRYERQYLRAHRRLLENARPAWTVPRGIRAAGIRAGSGITTAGTRADPAVATAGTRANPRGAAAGPAACPGNSGRRIG